MLALLQAVIRLVFVAVVAVGAWAGVKFELPGSPPTAEQRAAAENLREHSADVFARIEEFGIADTSTVSSQPTETEKIPPTAPATATPVTKASAPAATTPPASSVPAPKPASPAPAKPVASDPEPAAEPEPTWIETKLPASLYDPVEGAAAEAEENTDDDSLARNTTVNLACVRKDGSTLRITSGSGVVISPDGLILTDAHVAYFFLLGEDGVGCSITHPSFPIFGYPGQVVYISPDWVRKNRAVIGGTHTTASGEEDYAFVAFAPNSAPASLGALRYAPISLSEPVAETGDRLTVAGYPGAAATPEGYGSSSRLKVDEVQVEDVDSFGGSSVDIVQTSRTDVAGSGSSGGGAFLRGKLAGITVTIYRLGSGYGINSLSLPWINRDLKRDAGVSISDLIDEDPDAAAASFWSAEGESLAEIVRAALD